MNASRGICVWLMVGMLMAVLTCAAGADQFDQTMFVPDQTTEETTPQVVKLTNAQVIDQGPGITLKLSGDGELVCKHFCLSNPHRVVIDLFGVYKPMKVITPESHPFINQVRCGTFRKLDQGGAVIRYVVQTEQKPVFEVTSFPDGVELNVRPAAIPAGYTEAAVPAETDDKEEQVQTAATSTTDKPDLFVSEAQAAAINESSSPAHTLRQEPISEEAFFSALSRKRKSSEGPFVFARSSDKSVESTLLVQVDKPESEERDAHRQNQVVYSILDQGKTGEARQSVSDDPLKLPQQAQAETELVYDWDKHSDGVSGGYKWGVRQDDLDCESWITPGEPVRLAERESSLGGAEVAAIPFADIAPAIPTTTEPVADSYVAIPVPTETVSETLWHEADPEPVKSEPTITQRRQLEPAIAVLVETETVEETTSAPASLTGSEKTHVAEITAAAPMSTVMAVSVNEPDTVNEDPITETRPEVGADPFAAVIAEHYDAAVERAGRDWTIPRSKQNRAPQLGTADPDYALAEGNSTLPPMSMDVQSADIHTILRSIAEYAGVNIVADSNVKGTVTIRVIDLPWTETLETVCRAMSLVPIGLSSEVIRVATARTAQDESVAQETSERKKEEVMPLATRIVAMEFANAAEMEEIVNTVRTGRGKVDVDERTNSLILTDIEPRLNLLENMLNDLDSETMQVEITAEIVDIDATASRQLGISWGMENVHSSSQNLSATGAISADDVIDPVGDVQTSIIRDFGIIKTRLQALETANKADIISTPRITTVNARTARILVGKEVPLITMDYAGNPITELKKVGITLEVTPYLNSDEQITLDLHPEVSDLSSQATVTGGVVFNTTEADTRVMVKDGGTVVIGGLINTRTIEYKRGIPVLKDMPVFGRLFSSSDKRDEKRELLIFVTPRIVKSAQHTRPAAVKTP